MNIRPRTEPSFFVKVMPIGGQPERLDLSERVLGFTYEDSEKKADKLVLTVDNWDLANFDHPVWTKGNVLEVSWGYPGDMAPARQVVIQKVTGFQTLQVEGHARSVLMNRVTRSRTFESMRRSDVVRKIAEEHGYGPNRQGVEDTRHVLPNITQARLTDAQFLKRLAEREGFQFYVDFDGLHFHQRRLGQRPARVLRWYTPPEVGEVLAIHVENDVTAKPGAVRLKGRDPLAKRDIEEKGSNAKTERDTTATEIEIPDPEEVKTRVERRSGAEDVRPTPEPLAKTAKREADARFRNSQQTTVELTATVLGDPGLLAKTVVEFQGISQRLSGKYYVSEATHKIHANGYVVELKCLRDGHSMAGGIRSKGKPNVKKAEQADEGRLEPIEVPDPESLATRIQYRDLRGREAGGEGKKS